jgi:hypothetical protein
MIYRTYPAVFDLVSQLPTSIIAMGLLTPKSRLNDYFSRGRVLVWEIYLAPVQVLNLDIRSVPVPFDPATDRIDKKSRSADRPM